VFPKFLFEGKRELKQSGIEEHTFGLTNVRDHFPQEELTLLCVTVTLGSLLLRQCFRESWCFYQRFPKRRPKLQWRESDPPICL